LAFFAGIGPEFRSVINYVDFNNTLHDSGSQFGIGIGGTLEARLKLYKLFSLAGGVRISSIFFDRISRDRIILPYIGFGWN
jgi:hypothetical protein